MCKHWIQRPISAIAVAAAMLLVVAGCIDYDKDPHVHAGAADDSSPRVAGEDYYELRPINDTYYESDLDALVPVGVQLLDHTSAPASGESIEYEITSTTEDPDVVLDALNSITDDQGIANNRLHVGETTGTITVRADHPETEEPLDFEIDVTETPPGQLRVEADYEDDGFLALSGVDFRVYESRQIECEYVTPYEQPAVGYSQQAEVESHQDDAVMENLQSDLDYTVTASGLGPEGQISAHGCVDGIAVESGQTAEATVPMELLDLTVPGVYQAMSVWDFTEAIAASGPVGETIAEAIGWISDPTGMAADYMVEAAVGWVCANAGSGWCLAAQAAEATGVIQDVISSLLEDTVASVPGISDLLELGDELTNIIESPTIESRLTIEDITEGKGDLKGLDAWQAVIFEWNYGCDDNDPNCGDEIRIGLEDSYEFGAIQAEWTGRLYAYDQLEIDPHEMVIPYGQFILHVLRQYLIPAITGDDDINTLAGAFDELLCSNLGSFEVFGFGFDESTVQSFCNLVFSAAGILGENYIGALEFDIGLIISGEGRVIDTESNGVVDLIDDAFFYGDVENEDGQTAEMEAAFTAERIED